MDKIKKDGINIYFDHVYGGKRKDTNYEKDENKYPRYPKFTMNDKKIINSRYSPSTTKISKKIIMLFLSIMVLTLIFAHINKENNDYLTVLGIIGVSGLMVVPFFYIMVKSYYMYVLYFIVIAILGMLGYGWGLFSVLLNLNPVNKINIKNNIRNNIKR